VTTGPWRLEEASQMDTLVERRAGLDVHKDPVVACVRVPDGQGGRHAKTPSFTTTTAGLVLLAEWLASFALTRVGMEATGCYWRPVWQLLEGQLECWLLNAAHLRGRARPQRPTWPTRPGSPRLVEHGLVRPSFVPPRPIRELRDLTPPTARPRSTERGREVQRLDKVLQDAGIKLSSVAADVLGVSGRAMLAGPGRRHPRPGGPGRVGQGAAADQAAGVAGGPGRPGPHRPARAAGRPDPGPTSTTWTRRSPGCPRGSGR
jgi:transposase